MEYIKTGMVVVAALASTWAAGEVTSRWAEPPSLGLRQASPPPAEPAPSEAGAESPEAAQGNPPAAIEEVSREEMDEAIKQAEKELAGGGEDDKGQAEYRPTKPLPADISISLPSDF